MKFPDAFLDDLRARVPVSEVVGRKYKLRRQGQEFVAIEDKSITVNDKKRLWWDFGKGGDGGDIFKFLTEIEGLTFPEAVKTCASIAGLQVPGAAVNGSKPAAAAAEPPDDGAPPWGDDPEPAHDSAPRKI